VARLNENQTETSDGDLVARARVGDQRALAALCSRYRAPLVQFCRHYVRSPDAAEDVTHDVLARMAVEGKWPEKSFRAWLYRVARNHCLNYQHRRNRGPIRFATDFGDVEVVSPHTGPSTAAVRGELEDALRGALAVLPSELAEVLSLRYFQCLSRREMAEVLELSEGALKQRLVQARSELARKLGKEIR
jgi:RNA polymerase sigma-70 factor (ECF subfamily)